MLCMYFVVSVLFRDLYVWFVLCDLVVCFIACVLLCV